MAIGRSGPVNAGFPSTGPASPTARAVRRDTAGYADLDTTIETALNRFLSIQKDAGNWVFELEADCTIPAEYVLMYRFLGLDLDTGTREGIGRYLRRTQLPEGGWPLYVDGAADMSATVKAYFALKLIGDGPDEEHMARARAWVLSEGGASRVNVFTRITLALFGQVPWSTPPAMPVEIMHLPRWFFFHLDKVSYWSRTVIVPLLILYATRPVCELDGEEGVGELFREDPATLGNLDGFVRGNARKNAFILLDRVLKKVDPLIPSSLRKRAVEKAEDFTRRRMAGEGGTGAIFPAMVNSVMALKVLGCADDDPDYTRCLGAVDDLMVRNEGEAYCQPCHSPVWDTCLSLSAMCEAGVGADHPSVAGAVDWLLENQIMAPGDWSNRAPELEPGGWAFQYENTLYPDLDDTSMVVMAMLRAGALDDPAKKERIGAAVNWIIGMQNSDGGWGAFDIDNDYLYLNDIPFADHGALLDPSTSDLTARCLELLSMVGFKRDFPPVARAIEFLKREQEEWGAWFGRWGVNYLYGTWSVLAGLRQAGEDMRRPWVKHAVEWIKDRQNSDGGWGETCDSYEEPGLAGRGASTPSQTAWALMGLMSAGVVEAPEVQRGVEYLRSGCGGDGRWDERHFTGTGFPRVFYLRYHGYGQYFPLWALSVYRRLTTRGMTLQDEMKLSSPVFADLPAVERVK